MDRGEQIAQTLDALFPDWMSTIIILIVSAIISAVVNIYKMAVVKVFSISMWMINVSLSVAMAFFAIAVSHVVDPEISKHAETVVAIMAAIMSKEFLSFIQDHSIGFILRKLNLVMPKKE